MNTALVLILFSSSVSEIYGLGRTVSHFTEYYEGCFDGSLIATFKGHKADFSDNINEKCMDYCREKSYIVSATKGTSCYCANSLGPFKMQKKRPEDRPASGPGTPCDQKCPGHPDSILKCQGDTCCGGANGYSVFLSGNVDTAKTILRNVMNRVANPTFITKHFGSATNVQHRGWTVLYDRRIYPFNFKKGLYNDTSVKNAQECLTKCISKLGTECYAMTWLHEKQMCQMVRHIDYFLATVESEGNITIIYGQEIPLPNQGNGVLGLFPSKVMSIQGGNVMREYTTTHIDLQGQKCRWYCAQTTGCIVAEFVLFPSAKCKLYSRVGSLTETTTNFLFGMQNQPVYYLFTTNMLQIETQTTALDNSGKSLINFICSWTTPLEGQTSTNNILVYNSAGEVVYNGLKQYYNATQQNTTSLYRMILEPTNSEDELVYGSVTDKEPFGKYDFVVDNVKFAKDKNVDRTIEIVGETRSSITEDVGPSLVHTVDIGPFSFEYSGGIQKEKPPVKKVTTVGGGIGYQLEIAEAGKQQTASIRNYTTETYTVREIVPKHTKLYVNFFQQKNTLKLKWRKDYLASGKVDIKWGGQRKTFYLSHLLAMGERMVHAIGSVDYGWRESLSYLATLRGGDGRVVVNQLPK